jgi:ankyrin repeat protein
MIIELIKNKNIKELKNKIISDTNIDLNIKDENYNYFIYYVLLYNLEDVLDLVLERNIRLDILDSDGKNILFVPIKFAYNNILKKLVIYDSNKIGINILDIKDKLGLSALQYSIIFNNYNAFKILLEYKSNILITNSQDLNSFHIAIQYDRLNFFLDLINNISELNFYTKDKENLIQFCIINEKFDFIKYILKKKMNINSQEDLNGLTALHQIIIMNNKSIAILLISYGANINIADFYGNTSLHYAISEKNIDIIKSILNYNPNYNLTNIDCNTALHLYLSTNENENFYLEKDILKILIKNTDLNIQNNQGETCLKKIIDLNLFLDYQDILKDKELNFFIKDNYDQDISRSLNNEKIFDIAMNLIIIL